MDKYAELWCASCMPRLPRWCAFQPPALFSREFAEEDEYARHARETTSRRTRDRRTRSRTETPGRRRGAAHSTPRGCRQCAASYSAAVRKRGKLRSNQPDHSAARVANGLAARRRRARNGRLGSIPAVNRSPRPRADVSRVTAGPFAWGALSVAVAGSGVPAGGALMLTRAITVGRAEPRCRRSPARRGSVIRPVVSRPARSGRTRSSGLGVLSGSRAARTRPSVRANPYLRARRRSAPDRPVSKLSRTPARRRP